METDSQQAGKVKVWLGATRPKTLPAAAAPIIVGTAMAIDDGVEHWLSAVLALISALFIQVGTNLFNDYADFKKGGDTETRTGPQRITQAGLASPQQVRAAAVTSFALAAVAGGYLMARGGLPIVVIGILSITFGFLYTAGKYSLSYTGLADLFVLIFFGPVAVGGTYFVQALAIETDVVAAGFATGLLATAILLVNNIRDMNEDGSVGKKTIIVRFGRRTGYVLYGVCMLTAAAIPIWLVITQGDHYYALMAALIAVPGMILLARLVRATEGTAYNGILASTAGLLLLFSIVFAVGWNL